MSYYVEIDLTREELDLFAEAMDAASRMGCGQLRIALERLKVRDEFRDAAPVISREIERLWKGALGYDLPDNAYPGIYSPEVANSAKVGRDVYWQIQNKLRGEDSWTCYAGTFLPAACPTVHRNAASGVSVYEGVR